MSLRIRLAELHEVNAIAEFQIKMAWETEQKVLDKATVHAGVQAVFQDAGRGFYLVAEDDGFVVGSLLITKEWSDWRNTDIWYIQSVYVVESHRGMGCFRQMYATAVEMAKQQHVKVMRLYVEHENSKARSVYERLGMTPLPYVMYQTDL
ncbi:MAG: GNAT family N-acetyltransferase [Planctomycetaceae bacterium]|nr:GNAT family N-acetyltransferase [Planctomycetaceae bacterium]